MFITQEKKAAQDTEREARIREQEIENLTSSRHLEAVQIKSLLAQRGLQIHEVCTRGYPEVRGQIEYLFYLLSDVNENFTS